MFIHGASRAAALPEPEPRADGAGLRKLNDGQPSVTLPLRVLDGLLRPPPLDGTDRDGWH
jgi:hypothetical protein